MKDLPLIPHFPRASLLPFHPAPGHNPPGVGWGTRYELGRGRGLWRGCWAEPPPGERAGNRGQTSCLGLSWKPQPCLSPESLGCAKCPCSAKDCKAFVFKSVQSHPYSLWGEKSHHRPGRGSVRCHSDVLGMWDLGHGCVPQPWGSHCREAHGGIGRKGCNDHGKGDFRAVGKEGMWEGAGRAQVGALGLKVSVCALVV